MSDDTKINSKAARDLLSGLSDDDANDLRAILEWWRKRGPWTASEKELEP